MNQSDSIAELAGALAVAASTLTAVQHDKRSNGPAKNRYATLDAILETVRPQLQAVGVSIQQGVDGPPTTTEITQTAYAKDGSMSDRLVTVPIVSVSTQLTHASGQWIRSTVSMPVEPARGCSLVQSLGIHVTYLRRYSLLAILGLSTTEDDRSAPHMADDTDGVMPPAPKGERPPVPHGAAGQVSGMSHDKSFTDAARKAFCAKLNDAGVSYEEVAAYCTRLSRPRPSCMDAPTRAKLLVHVLADPSVVVP